MTGKLSLTGTSFRQMRITFQILFVNKEEKRTTETAKIWNREKNETL